MKSYMQLYSESLRASLEVAEAIGEHDVGKIIEEARLETERRLREKEETT